jgi:hypothetical protein
MSKGGEKICKAVQEVVRVEDEAEGREEVKVEVEVEVRVQVME